MSLPTTRYRLDLSLIRRHAIGDWIVDRVEDVHLFVSPRVVELGWSL